MGKNILIIAGEPSGDVRGAELVKELKKTIPDARFRGFGGNNMERQGVKLIEHVRNLSFMGLVGVLKNLGKIRHHFLAVKKTVKENRPDLAILIDYPGFNLRIARFLYKMNVPVVYYIIPQVWIWHAGRVKQLKAFCKKILVLFKFEKIFLAERDTDSVFVGHPLLNSAPEIDNSPKEKTTVALLPGSRKNEIKNIFPHILDAASIINKKFPEVEFILARNSNVPEELYDEALSKHPVPHIRPVYNDTFTALNKSDYALVTSGTAALEAAIMEKPMVVTYKTAPLTYFIAMKIVRYPYISLVNIIPNREIVPECLQNNATGENMAEKIINWIENPDQAAKTKAAIIKVKQTLGEKGAARRAAQEIVNLLESTESAQAV
jgi:lipid-A-disaccharide synthase